MIRSEGYQANIPCLTTMSAAMAAVEGIQALEAGDASVQPIQDDYRTAPVAQPAG